MKKLLLSIICCYITTTCVGQTNFTDYISDLWYSGQKQTVLDIANARIATNTSDIAGLLMKMAYEIEFLEDDELTNTMSHVLTVGSSITSSNFTAVFSQIQNDVSNMYELITLTPLTQAELEQERLKGNIANKPFMYNYAIQALENDGYFD